MAGEVVKTVGVVNVGGWRGACRRRCAGQDRQSPALASARALPRLLRQTPQWYSDLYSIEGRLRLRCSPQSRRHPRNSRAPGNSLQPYRLLEYPRTGETRPPNAHIGYTPPQPARHEPGWPGCEALCEGTSTAIFSARYAISIPLSPLSPPPPPLLLRLPWSLSSPSIPPWTSPAHSML
jgi:hypothetical protein